QALQPLEAENTKLQAAIQKTETIKQQLDKYTQNMEERFYWLHLLTEIRDALLAAEAKTEEPGVRTGVWIETFAPEAPNFGEAVSLSSNESGEESEGAAAARARRFYLSDPALAARYGLNRSMTPAAEEGATGAAKGPSTNEISTIEMTCRALTTKKTPDSNFQLAHTLLTEIRARTNWFVPDETQFVGEIKKSEEASEPTFTFKMKLKLAQSVKL
ncbi:MAG TPA: hypothetical protein PK256_26315, partial [Verrucomicrobiota bacterium]|nr:hypothetical protein [Verrucomicrobiota bacterium]